MRPSGAAGSKDPAYVRSAGLRTTRHEAPHGHVSDCGDLLPRTWNAREELQFLDLVRKEHGIERQPSCDGLSFHALKSVAVPCEEVPPHNWKVGVVTKSPADLHRHDRGIGRQMDGRPRGSL